jgi:hypothetical protein
MEEDRQRFEPTGFGFAWTREGPRVFALQLSSIRSRDDPRVLLPLGGARLADAVRGGTGRSSRQGRASHRRVRHRVAWASRCWGDPGVRPTFGPHRPRQNPLDPRSGLGLEG